MLKDLVFFRSRRSIGMGIATKGTARVAVVTLIGILLEIVLEIVLDMMMLLYYDSRDKGRPKILGGFGLLRQDMRPWSRADVLNIRLDIPRAMGRSF